MGAATAARQPPSVPLCFPLFPPAPLRLLRLRPGRLRHPSRKRS